MKLTVVSMTIEILEYIDAIYNLIYIYKLSKYNKKFLNCNITSHKELS